MKTLPLQLITRQGLPSQRFAWAFPVSTYFNIFHILMFTKQRIHLSVPLNLYCQVLQKKKKKCIPLKAIVGKHKIVHFVLCV